MFAHREFLKLKGHFWECRIVFAQCEKSLSPVKIQDESVCFMIDVFPRFKTEIVSRLFGL